MFLVVTLWRRLFRIRSLFYLQIVSALLCHQHHLLRSTMAPKAAAPLLERIAVTAAELENPAIRDQARALLEQQWPVMLAKAAKTLCVPVEDLSFSPPDHAHAPRGQTTRLGGKTFQAWACANCKKRFIHMMKNDGETQRPVYIRIPDCETTRLSKERWLLEQHKTQKSTRGQVPTLREYPWHRSLEQFLELSQAYAAPAPAASTAGSFTATTAGSFTTAASTAGSSAEATAIPAVIREPPGPVAQPVELQAASNAGATTVQHFMTTGAPVRDQVQAEMERATAYMASLAQNLAAAEAMMQASQQRPIPEEEDDDWQQPQRPNQL